MKTSVGRTKLEVALGDITQLEIDAVATSANAELVMDAGVSGAVKRAGGEAIEREAMLQGPIEPGQAVATAGHALTADWVIHAAVMGADRRTDSDLVARAVYSALACAERCRARSLALPAFGVGVGGVRVQQCASVMIDEVVRYLEDHPRTGLRRIVFVAHDDVAKAAFQHALAGVRRV